MYTSWHRIPTYKPIKHYDLIISHECKCKEEKSSGISQLVDNDLPIEKVQL